MTTPLLPLAHRLPRPLAYVFGGGGSWGALQLGMLRALAETDLRPDLVVGTSVGSMNGAVVAADPDLALERLDAVWHSVTRAQVFPGGWLRGVRTLTETRSWIYDNEPLTGLITAKVPATTFEELALPFVAVATDYTHGTEARLDRGDLRSALLASSAIPGIYPWVERDGRRLVDGMLVANVPIKAAVDRGAKSVVVLDCGVMGAPERASNTLVDVLIQSMAIYARGQVAADIRDCADTRILWLSRATPNRTTQLDFTHTDELAADGYESAWQALRAAADVQLLPSGLYGGPLEFTERESIGQLMLTPPILPPDAVAAATTASVADRGPVA